jgi:hypothetical protein
MEPIEQQDDPLQPPPLGQSLQAGRTAASPAPGFEPGKLLDGWNSWVDKPNNRAALMQFGIAMLQPMGMGETGASHFANSVGAAGEAGQRVTGQEQQARKEDTSATLREATAGAREQTANAAELRALQTGENQRLRSENQQLTGASAALRAQSDARGKYAKEKQDWDLFHPKEPFPSFQDWSRENSATNPVGGVAGSASTPAVGGKQKWVDLQRDPQLAQQISSVRAHVSTGRPKDIEHAQQYIQTVIAPRVDPSELPSVYMTLGVPSK